MPAVLPWLLGGPTPAAVPPVPPAWRLRAAQGSRFLTAEDGLPATACSRVVQDERGFLWVTTAEGVARLDGGRVTRVTGPGTWLVAGSGPANRIVVGDADQRLADLRGGALAPVTGLDVTTSSVVDDRGRLWVVSGGRTRLEDGAGGFRATPPEQEQATWAGGPRLVGAGRDGAVFVEAGGELLRVDDGGGARLGRSLHASKAVDRGDGTVVSLENANVAANNRGTVLSHRGGSTRTLYAGDPRAIDLVGRDGELFVVLDSAVVRIDANDAVETLSVSGCCGAALADRDGGLWLATELGLGHLPSPRTATFPASAIRPAASADGLWVATWNGPRHLRREGGDAVARQSAPFTIAPCTDVRGDTWAISGSGMGRLRTDGPPELFPGPGIGGAFNGCAHGDDGRTWFASPRGLLVSDPNDPVPHRVAAAVPTPPQASGSSVAAVLETDGVLLYGVEGSLCRAPVDRVLALPDPSWSCADLPDPGVVWDLEVTATGAVWAAASRLGVLAGSAHADAWTPIPASAALRTGTLGFLTRSPRGGLWVLAEGDVVRVHEADTPAGWRVVERLGAAQGLRVGATPRELVETPTGDLWLVTLDGDAAFVPASARSGRPEPPGVHLAEVLGPAGPHDPAVPLVLPAAAATVELRFVAPVFADRSSLAYRFRVRPDDPWSAPTPDASLRFAALASGRYAVEVAATVDGERWSAEPARFSFRVQAPWYRRPWFVLLAGASVAGAASAAHRARLRAATRLERQRARIARDLHDEIGSGLGSIGLLAGLARRGQGGAATLEMVERITTLATELGSSLGDIVTSLRPGAANLRALHAHVVERGTALCGAGSPRLEADPSEQVPEVPLSVSVRINVYLVGVEAIHNAVRHAGARVIGVRLEPTGRRHWTLTVTDDGAGLPEAPRGGVVGGTGLAGLRERAREIGGTLTFSRPTGGGTEVRLQFDPRAEERTT